MFTIHYLFVISNNILAHGLEFPGGGRGARGKERIGSGSNRIWIGSGSDPDLDRIRIGSDLDRIRIGSDPDRIRSDWIGLDPNLFGSVLDRLGLDRLRIKSHQD